MKAKQLINETGGKTQRGIVLVLVVVAMTSILGLAGLALDFGLAFLTKSRIQNALDAAALSGAKSLKTTGFTAARNSARTAFDQYLSELNRLPANTPITIEFASRLESANFTTTPEGVLDVDTVTGLPVPKNRFIRVRLGAGYQIPTYLTRVFPGVGNSLALSGSAVAGAISVAPPAEVCDLVPIIADSPVDPATGTVDTDCRDGRCFGYTVGQPYVLKDGDTAGAGNFNLLSQSGNGGNDLRDDLAGGSARCRTSDGTISGVGEELSKPGGTNGPFKQGIETRFGIYKGGGVSSADYPPDVYTGDVLSYQAYKDIVAAPNFQPVAGGVPGRRLIRIAFANFDAEVNDNVRGRSNIVTTGVGCFFLLEPVDGKGNAGGNGKNAGLSGEGSMEDSFVAALSRPRAGYHYGGGFGQVGGLLKVQSKGNTNGGGNTNGNGTGGGNTNGNGTGGGNTNGNGSGGGTTTTGGTTGGGSTGGTTTGGGTTGGTTTGGGTTGGTTTGGTTTGGTTTGGTTTGGNTTGGTTTGGTTTGTSGGGHGGNTSASACDAIADYKGNGPQRICAEFTLDCNLPDGGITSDALNNNSFFRIVLYKDPGSVES